MDPRRGSGVTLATLNARITSGQVERPFVLPPIRPGTIAEGRPASRSAESRSRPTTRLADNRRVGAAPMAASAPGGGGRESESRQRPRKAAP